MWRRGEVSSTIYQLNADPITEHSHEGGVWNNPHFIMTVNASVFQKRLGLYSNRNQARVGGGGDKISQ